MDTSDHTRIYTPDSSMTNPRVLIGEMGRDFLNSRGLAWRLAVRDIRAMYRQSILGLLWAFILPLSNTVTWIFLRNSGIVSVGETGIPYPVYVFTGTMLWAVLVESVQMPLQKTLGNKALLTKINFPREALILSGFYHALFNAVVKVGLLVLGMLMLRYNFLDWTLLLFPISLFVLILAGFAIGLLLTPVGLLYTDIAKGLPVLMQFLMYLTPVVYPVPRSGWVATMISWNPLSVLVTTTRDWLTGSTWELNYAFFWIGLGFAGLLLVGWVLFRSAIPILVERMSA